MKIAVLGVGAIGGVIGGYLARADIDVTVIDMWPANIDHIKAHGLIVTAVEEAFTAHPRALHLGEVSAARQTFNVVILAVKSYDTVWSVRFIEPYLAPGGYIVSAQNGINDDIIAENIGWTREVGCVVTIGAGMFEAGHAMRTTERSRPSFKIGEPSGLVTTRAKALVEVFETIGPTITTTNLWGERWSKLATNCMVNALAGITGLSSADIRRNPATRNLAIRNTAEVLEVAEAYGVQVEPISGVPSGKYRDALLDRTVMKEVENILVEGSAVLRDGIPSLAQDVRKSRKTEIDYLNGLVSRKGAVMGVATPINDAIIRLTRRVEAGELEPSLSNLHLLK